MNFRLLLDAHTILFLLYEPEKLPPYIRFLLSDKVNELLVSEATLWEIVNKAAAMRLPMAGSDPSAIQEDIQALGVSWLPITQTTTLAAASLPGFHRDPFDRILIAEAQSRGLILVTKDADILLYDINTLWK